MHSNSQPRRRVLVVGLGISGCATALQLQKLGWEPVIVERAPARRRGGYFMALFGTGEASATRLGVIDAIGDRMVSDGATYEVNRAATRRLKGLSFADAPGDPRMVLRGDIENALLAAVSNAVEIRFSTSPTDIQQDEHGVDVTLSNAQTGAETSERFDLVVGADGMRSTVRRLVFGPDENYLFPLNYMIGACLLREPVRGYGLRDGVILAEVGRSAWVFPFENHSPSVLFSYRVDDVDAQFRGPAVESIRRAFGPRAPGPILSQLLDEFDAAPERLFDSVNQVRMDRWHSGRVVLMGDAAWCLTLYSGMGASTGMAGGELLGKMLEQYPQDVARALGAWEAKLRPFISALQRDAIKSRVLFTPHDDVQFILRASMVRLARVPLLKPLLQRLGGDMGLKSTDIAA